MFVFAPAQLGAGPKAKRFGQLARSPSAVRSSRPEDALKEFYASINIAASPERVWEVLMNAAEWPNWDPSCERIEGTIAPGATIKAFTKLSPGRAFSVKVTTFEPPRKMVWTGGMPLGLFKGRRSFNLLATEIGTEFSLHEVFTGPILVLIGGSIRDMSDPFHAFCRGLKSRAEAS